MKYLKIISTTLVLSLFTNGIQAFELNEIMAYQSLFQLETRNDTVKKKPLSPHTSTMAMVGGAHIHIDYSSPGVRGRIIYGGLVAYDNVWQSGAHKATWIDTNQDLVINGKVLPKGKYGFFTIPSKEEWTVIFNKNWDQHGKDEYDQKDDVIRFKVKPILSDKIQEHLEYKIVKDTDKSGSINLSWEKITIKVPFEVQ